MRPLMLPETPISPPTRQPSTAHTPHTHAQPRPHSTHYAHAGNGPVDDKGPFTTAISAATHGGTFGVSLAPPPEHFKQTTDQLRGHLLHGGHALGDRLHAMKRGRRDKRLGGGEDDAATTRIAEKLTTIIEADDLGEGLTEQLRKPDCNTGVNELVSRWLGRARQPGGGLFNGEGEYLSYHDCAVQPVAQPRLVTRLGLAARLQLVLELPNKHVHQVLVDHLCSREGSTRAGILS